MKVGAGGQAPRKDDGFQRIFPSRIWKMDVNGPLYKSREMATLSSDERKTAKRLAKDIIGSSTLAWSEVIRP
jgi:hypothetical protein